MNQYIITEEQLQGYEKTRNRLYDINGEHYVTGFAVKIQSHPYQSNDKVLDEMIRRIEFRFEDTNQGRGVVGVMREMINKYKEELRQAGES